MSKKYIFINIMISRELFLVFYLFVECGYCIKLYSNVTTQPALRQLYDFKQEHPIPIGLQTTSAGEPIEVRNIFAVNSDQFANQYHLDLATHMVGIKLSERLVHAVGTSAFGYFEVTHDISMYTNADVFNGIGKKTPLVVRFSSALPNLGGSEIGRDLRGLAVKFYTEEGNLDLLCSQIPVYLYKDPIDFPMVVRARRRNPRSNLFDHNMSWDFITLKPIAIHGFLWMQSDFGIPKSYRNMDAFPVHTYEISNKHGDRYYVKFHFRTEQGLDNFTNAESMAISAEDPAYFTRDLYNAIEEKNYPAWKLEMDIMKLDDIKNLDYNPFDITRVWKIGTYHTVPIGRLVLNRTVENHFRDSEQSAFNPGNLVPGIPGPVDFLYKLRKFSYLDAQNYRLGRNHNNIVVNTPKYAKTYNRDGVPPLNENMKDAPIYYPNSFNGPIPTVDESKPKQKLIVLENNAIDLEPSSYFYNHVLESDAHRQRVADNTAASLLAVYPSITKRALKLLNMVDNDLGKRVTQRLKVLRGVARKQSNEERYRQNAQCFAYTDMNKEKIQVRLDGL